MSLGVALGVAQITWQFARKKPIETMEWMSLFLVVGSGAATLLTLGSRLVMIKPSLTYIIVGIVMLQPEWMNHYLPNLAKDVVHDIAVILATLARPNVVVALNFAVASWSEIMSAYGIRS